VPEYIVFDKPNMAKDMIFVLEEGMRLSKSNVVTKEEFKKIQKQDAVEDEKKAKEFKEERLSQQPDETNSESLLVDTNDEEKNKELIKQITAKYKLATVNQKAELKNILAQAGATKLDPTLPTKVFEDILKIFA
jgi:hypothetical protein